MTKSLDTIAKPHPVRVALDRAFGQDRLLDHRQPLDMLPSRFWNRLDTWKYQLPFVGAGVVLMSAVMLLSYPPLFAVMGSAATWVMLPMLYLAMMLPLGLFEKWLRAEIQRRRLATTTVARLPPSR